MAENDRRRREHAAREFLDVLFMKTEHQDITKVQAFREMCEAAITVYDGTEDQRVADWAREALRLLDERS
jgi:aromatic ring hydroxylase